MKKIIYSLGLSVLLSYPSWAQEQVVANTAPTPSPMSEEDAQTIFFSEDFLNDLTSDNDDEVLIFNDIPLDKNSEQKQNTVPAQNTPQAPQLQPKASEAPAKADVQPQQISQPVAPNMSAPAKAPKPTEVKTAQEPQKETNPQPAQPVVNAPMPPAQVQPASSEPAQPTEQAPQEQYTKPIYRPVAPKAAPVQPQDDMNAKDEVQKPQEPVAPQKAPSSEEQIAPAPVRPENNLPPVAPQVENALSGAPQEEVPTPQSEVRSKPTIQELLQEKMRNMPAPAPEPEPEPKPAPAPAPSEPEKNAFSLDDKAPLPKSMLQEEGFSTNMLNRGIRISPEQRARMMMKKKFAEMDLNQDGIITKAEFIRFKTAEAQKISAQVYQQIDSNGDNILSEKEYEVLMDKMIENYIKNPQK